MATPLTDKAALLAAEQNLAELRRQIRATEEKATSVEDEKALIDPLDAKMWDLW
jgi:hypothetical protein